MMPKLGHFGKYTRNVSEVSICAEEGWRKSAERPCKKKIKERNMPHTIKRRKSYLDFSHLVYELTVKTCCGRKCRRNETTWKKT
jgi:hypothetical protein